MTTSSGPRASSASSSSGVREKTTSVPTRRAVSRIRATKNRSLTAATTLIVLLRVAEPVLVPLGQMRQRRQISHPVEVHHAVQVVGLVLDHAGEELLRDRVDLPAVAVVGFEAN